ncbi:hypothetical protein Q7P37_007457 [Cladosporium fusiforme]
MVQLSICPPPSAAHNDCGVCNEHYLSVAAQRNGQRYGYKLKDFEARSILKNLQQETNENLKHAKDLLVSHGDVILSRWKKLSQEKRANRLIEASNLFKSFETFSRKSAWDQPMNGLVKWIKLDAFSQDRMKLLSLLHVRTEYEPQLWAPFDTRSSYGYFSVLNGMLYFNEKSVIMHGKHYGNLVPFDVNSAYGWATMGFPRAILTFAAQLEISKLLKNMVDLLTVDANASGNTKWMSMVMEGLHSVNDEALWSTYHDQEFAPPARFDPDIFLEKARDHLSILVDEIELMQTDPEYMRQYILHTKATCYFESNKSPDEKWEVIARIIMVVCTGHICRWQRVVVECENLKTTLAKSGMVVEKGACLTKDADAAMRCFGDVLSSWLIWASEVETYCLKALPNMQESFATLDKSEKKRPGAEYWDPKKDLDPSNQNDRVLYFAAAMQDAVIEDRHCGLSSLVRMFKGELVNITYGKAVESWLSGMALLDELYGLWYWRQMTDYHDPLNESAIKAEVLLRDMLPSSFRLLSKEHAYSMFSTAGDLECGQLMRAFCETQPPKGTKDLLWLTKMTEARKRLTEIWDAIRAIFNDRQLTIERAELFRAAVIAQMSFDKSPEYLARVEAERQRIEGHDRVMKATKNEKHQSSQFVQQAWDSRMNEDITTRRTLTKKTNAARSNTRIEDDLERPALRNTFSTDAGHPSSGSALMPQIAVKQDTLSVISKMYPTGADGTSSIRWSQLLQALTDAGLTVTQGAGSAVSFANEQGCISIHKPHPEPIIDAVSLRGLGRRFGKWFGWNIETFVLRKKEDEKSEPKTSLLGASWQ